MASATQIAREIRARILAETRLTASAGISYNKFLAKLASDYRKPNGQFVVRPEQGLAFVEGLAVGQFHGVGPVTAARMNQLGIFTGADLRAQTGWRFCGSTLARPGSYYYAIARAEDERPVVADRLRKSMGSETTFAQDLTRVPRPAGRRCSRCMEDVWEYCQRSGIRGAHGDAEGEVCRLPANHPQPQPAWAGAQRRPCWSACAASWWRACFRWQRACGCWASRSPT